LVLRRSNPLQQLPPDCVPFERRRYRNGVAHDVTEYRSVVSGQKDLALQGSSEYPPARRFALRLAREWGVGFRGLDGRVRTAQNLDAPLKPGKNRIARLDPESGVLMEENEGVATLRSSVLPRSSGFPNLHILGGAGLGFVGLSERHADQVFLDLWFNPQETLLLALLTAAALAAAGVFFFQVWAFVQPARLSVDGSRVRYRGRSLPVADVREVVSTSDILILTDRGHIALPADFCKPSATPVVVGTIHQLIADRATGAALARP